MAGMLVKGGISSTPLLPSALRVVTMINERVGWKKLFTKRGLSPWGLANYCKAAADKMVTNSISEI